MTISIGIIQEPINEKIRLTLTLILIAYLFACSFSLFLSSSTIYSTIKRNALEFQRFLFITSLRRPVKFFLSDSWCVCVCAFLENITWVSLSLRKNVFFPTFLKLRFSFACHQVVPGLPCLIISHYCSFDWWLPLRMMMMMMMFNSLTV